MTPGASITTIGHGAASFGEVAALLEAHGVDTIVDVRSIPYSHHAPDFQKPRLEHLAAGAGLGYRWMGDGLGGRPRHPSLLGPDGRPDAALVTGSLGFTAGILAVEGLVTGGRITILCAEEDPARCHRAFWIAPALEGRGHRVIHLRHDGTAHRHQPSLGL